MFTLVSFLSSEYRTSQRSFSRDYGFKSEEEQEEKEEEEEFEEDDEVASAISLQGAFFVVKESQTRGPSGSAWRISRGLRKEWLLLRRSPSCNVGSAKNPISLEATSLIVSISISVVLGNRNLSKFQRGCSFYGIGRLLGSNYWGSQQDF